MLWRGSEKSEAAEDLAAAKATNPDYCCTHAAVLLAQVGRHGPCSGGILRTASGKTVVSVDGCRRCWCLRLRSRWAGGPPPPVAGISAGPVAATLHLCRRCHAHACRSPALLHMTEPNSGPQQLAVLGSGVGGQCAPAAPRPRPCPCAASR